MKLAAIIILLLLLPGCAMRAYKARTCEAHHDCDGQWQPAQPSHCDFMSCN